MARGWMWVGCGSRSRASGSGASHLSRQQIGEFEAEPVDRPGDVGGKGQRET
jgi:hypothetical protein